MVEKPKIPTLNTGVLTGASLTTATSETKDTTKIDDTSASE